MNNVNKVKPIVRKEVNKLLSAKSKEEITVSELTKRCKISRASFYRNYKLIDDVFYDCFYSKFEAEIQNIKRYPQNIKSNLKSLIKAFNKSRIFEEFFDRRKHLPFLIEIFTRELPKDSFMTTCIIFLITWLSNGVSISSDEIIDYCLKIHNLDKTIVLKSSEVVLSTKTMRESDTKTTESGVPSKDLMYRAGLGVFNSYDWKGKVAIVCGKGNNAGDGFVLATLLNQNNFDVEILRIDENCSTDGEYYLNKCVELGIKNRLINENVSFEKYDIIVDAIFGTGFNGEVKTPYKEIINNINSANKTVISVDINSGLNGDNGMCDVAVKSDLTISVGSYKSGLFLNKAKDYISNLTNIDIGIEPTNKDYTLLGKEDVKKCIKDRQNFSNKGTYGYVALLGGSSKYSGAIKLASMANASIQSGSGVTTLVVPKCISDSVTKKVVEATVLPINDVDGHIKYDTNVLDELISKYRTICVGMGLGTSKDVYETIKYLLNNYKGNLIIDADGLNVLSKMQTNLVKNSGASVILTPHIKEFSRLTGFSVEDISNNPISLAKEYAEKTGSIVLLKGPTTVVTDGKKVKLVNKGTSGMATGGSGDVLSGILSSMVSYNEDNKLNAIASGAYINGLAGELAEMFSNDISMSSRDTIRNISRAINVVRNNTNKR